MVVAACLDDELARESLGRGGSSGSGAGPATGPQPRTHGELTRALLEQLKSIRDDAELSDLRWDLRHGDGANGGVTRPP